MPVLQPPRIARPPRVIATMEPGILPGTHRPRSYLYAYVAPDLSSDVTRGNGEAGDALRLKISGVESLSLSAVGTVPGVAVLSAGGANGPGTGYLRSTSSTVAWKAPGSSTYGAPVRITADGVYVLQDGADDRKFVRVQVYVDYLSDNLAEAAVYLADRYGNAVGHDDVTAGEAAAGNAETYQITVENASPVAIKNVKAWIQEGARLEIGTDGSNWYAPTDENHVDAVTWAEIIADGTETLHVRRTVAAGVGSNTGILHALGFAWDGI